MKHNENSSDTKPINSCWKEMAKPRPSNRSTNKTTKIHNLINKKKNISKQLVELSSQQNKPLKV